MLSGTGADVTPLTVTGMPRTSVLQYASDSPPPLMAKPASLISEMTLVAEGIGNPGGRARTGLPRPGGRTKRGACEAAGRSARRRARDGWLRAGAARSAGDAGSPRSRRRGRRFSASERSPKGAIDLFVPVVGQPTSYIRAGPEARRPAPMGDVDAALGSSVPAAPSRRASRHAAVESFALLDLHDPGRRADGCWCTDGTNLPDAVRAQVLVMRFAAAGRPCQTTERPAARV